MGGKNSCEVKWCKNEATYICMCKNIKLCSDCFEHHRQSNPNDRHEPVPINDARKSLDNVPSAITLSNLIFTRNIYRSPEGSTEVSEGRIKDVAGKVAIKTMICRSEGDFKKKQKEAELQVLMKHSNICKCITAFLDQSYQYGYKYVIVMEFSENGDVEQDIENRRLRNNPWAEAELMTHMTELIDAFAYLQEKNLSHGDVKPRNLFIANDGKMKIGDFGESRQGMHALVTRTYQVTGTVIYFSPLLFKAYLEIIKGKNLSGDVRHNPIKSDVYSLGLSFLHMASLNKPIELNNLEIGADALQNQVERAIAKLNYSERIKMLFGQMLPVLENRRSDFIQLRAFLIEMVNGPPQITIIQSSPLPSTPRNDARPGNRTPTRNQSSISGPVLFSLAQTPGKANVYNIHSRKLTTLSSHRFQYSSRACVLNENVIVTGGLKNSNNVFSIHLRTCASVKLEDMIEPRA